MARRPNVLFILSDQHNAKVIGCGGHRDVQTPHLDRMAAEGVRFTSALSPITICTPSRVCFLSGQYSHNHGHFGFGGPKPVAPTVLRHFRRAGYHTACLGKMHCPAYWLEEDSDEYYETDRTSAGGSCREYLDYQARRGINIYDEYGLPGHGCPSPFAYEDSQEGWCARQTVEVMRHAADAGKPFFIHLSLTKPHQPYTPARQFWDLYDESRLSLPPNADYDLLAARKAPYLIDVSDNARRSPTFAADRLAKLHGYLGNVTHCDYAIGEVLAFLDEAHLAEETIIVYSADHGEYACEHGPNEKVPGISADAVTRVPMIWRFGGKFKAGHVAGEIVEGIDVVPTSCALAGLEPMDTADGKDLTPLLQGRRGELRTIGVTEYPLSRSVRKGKWRLVYYPPNFFADRCPDGFGELYDLEADPWEKKNLYFDRRYAGIVHEMRLDLLDWLVSTSRPVTAYTPGKIASDGKMGTADIQASLPNAPYL